MTDLIQNNYIFLDENYKSKQDVLEFIAKKAKEYGICKDENGLLADLLKREQEFSTGLQDGFAIPHARSSYVEKVSVFFIRNVSKLDWETLDDSEVHNLFALLVPEKNEEIIQFAKKRNPYNHPCVMYKKIAVESVGSYQDFYLLEDYYLWLRMIMAGYKGYNIQKPLLYMRAGSDMYKRRSGWQYAQSQLNLLKYMKKNNFIKNSQYLKGCVIRSGSSLAPNWLRKFMFERILREAN